MNITAYQLLVLSVVRRIAAINGVEIVEPEVIGTEVIECAGIFFAPVCHQAGRVEITCVHFFVYLECERTQLQPLSRYTRKNGNHQWSQSIADLHCQGATTGVDGIVNVRRKKNMPGSGRDFLE